MDEIIRMDVSSTAHPGVLFGAEKYSGQGHPWFGPWVGAEEEQQQIMISRFYGNNIGRFLKPDNIITSIANPQGWNRYNYVLGNPVSFADPTGHFSSKTSGPPVLLNHSAGFGFPQYYSWTVHGHSFNWQAMATMTWDAYRIIVDGLGNVSVFYLGSFSFGKPLDSSQEIMDGFNWVDTQLQQFHPITVSPPIEGAESILITGPSRDTEDTPAHLKDYIEEFSSWLQTQLTNLGWNVVVSKDFKTAYAEGHSVVSRQDLIAHHDGGLALWDFGGKYAVADDSLVSEIVFYQNIGLFSGDLSVYAWACHSSSFAEMLREKGVNAQGFPSWFTSTSMGGFSWFGP